MVGDLDFGIRIDIENFILDTIEKIPKSNSVDACIIMRDFYENEFGIFPHFNKKYARPLSSVEIHPSEEIVENSLLEEAIYMFVKNKIKDTFGISLIEFFNLPLDVIKLLVKISNEEHSSSNALSENIEKELKKLQ